MKIAAIDIGSNAIRLQVTNVLEYQGKVEFKKLEYVRFPLRLGHDVFTRNRITDKNYRKFKKLMHAFKLLLELYEVEDYMACATSAMREAENGKEIADEIHKDLELEINIIDGNQEAAFINKAIFSYLTEDPYLHIDVGGGSTELSYIKQRKKINSDSFSIGSVRRLEHHDSPEVWSEMRKWVESKFKKISKITAVGTGGNINKVFDLANKKPGDKLSLVKIKEIRKMLENHSQEERINLLKLNPDRADVIIPATDIYISVMEWAKIKNIIVPDVGLKDGIMAVLFEKVSRQEKLGFLEH